MAETYQVDRLHTKVDNQRKISAVQSYPSVSPDLPSLRVRIYLTSE